MEVGNVTKAATFKNFLHLSYKNTQLLFFVTVLFNIFIRQTLTDDFWGLHKNMNCAFPLITKFEFILSDTTNICKTTLLILQYVVVFLTNFDVFRNFVTK